MPTWTWRAGVRAPAFSFAFRVGKGSWPFGREETTLTKIPSARERKAAAFQRFAQLYTRKARRGADSNDRGYDHDVEQAVKRMPPETLDAILRDGEDAAI